MRKIITRKRVRKWEAVCGVCCFIAGILGPLLGLLLIASEWIMGSVVQQWTHIAGTTLLIAGIPLILFAGFCLDWAEREQKEVTPEPQATQRGAARLGPMRIIGNLPGVVLVPGNIDEHRANSKVGTSELLKRGSKTLGG